MTTLFIVVAIITAIALLFKHAMPPRKVRFESGERMSDAAFYTRLAALGKRLSVTENGFGISSKGVDIKNITTAIEKKLTCNLFVGEWAINFIRSKKKILVAFQSSKRAVRKSYTLGHVGGYPRLFLLCKELVECMQGDLTVDKLKTAVGSFERHAPLNAVERKFFSDMLTFCLLGYLSNTISLALKRSDSYDQGVIDGQNGKADLDRIMHGDYVCGMFSVAPKNEVAALERLLEANGISHTFEYNERNKRLAKTFAIVAGVLRSLDIACDIRQYESESVGLPLDLRKRRAVNIFNAAAIATAVISVIAVGIFMPTEYFGVSFVICVIAYACFRLPVLVVAPTSELPILSRLTELIYSKFKPIRKRGKDIALPEQYVPQVHFCGYSERNENSPSGGYMRVRADNGGRVFISPRGDGYKDCGLYLFFNDGQGVVDLSSCNGIYENHKTVYRSSTACTEFSAEFISPIDSKTCCCKITAVNRTDSEERIEITALYAMPSKHAEYIGFNGAREAIASIDGKTVSLAFDKQADFSRTAYEAASKNGAVLSGRNYKTLSGVCGFSVNPFSKNTALLVIAQGECEREAMLSTEYATSQGYFEYAEECLKIYCSDEQRNASLSGEHEENYGEILNAQCELDDEKNATVLIPKQEYALKFGCGGFTEDGAYLMNGVRKESAIGALTDILFDGCMGAELATCGVRGLFLREAANIITGTDECGLIENPSVFAVLRDGGVLWSPTVLPLGKGEMSVEYAYSHAEYRCAYNGIISSFKCYLAREKKAVIFDLNIQNTENKRREIEIMFSALAHENRKLTTERTENGIAALGEDGNGFMLFSSLTPTDYTLFREGYFVRGKIRKTSSFFRGGNTVAPTMSVRVNIGVNGSARAVFCIAACEGGVSEIDGIDEYNADEYFAREQKYFSEFWKIDLSSSDKLMNFMYKRSLYQAYVYGFLQDKKRCIEEICTILCAAKYVSPRAVKSRISELLSRQSENGKFEGGKLYGLLVAHAAVDYIEYTQDHSFKNECIPFKNGRAHGRKKQTVYASAAEHCLRVLDCADEMLCDRPCDVLHGIIYDKLLIELLHYFSGINNISVERKEKYMRTLCRVVARYTDNVKELKSHVIRVRPDLALATALYCAGEFDKAFECLKLVASHDSEEITMCACNSAPYLFRNIRTESDDGAITAALYFSMITEYVLGIKIKGRSLKINPRISANTPHLEFDIAGNSGKTHFIIDDTEKHGEWHMRKDKICYSAVDALSVDVKSDEKIIFYRSGRTH
ncbi:MAG: hypothetical protein J1G01_02110 [Clostridiales bacterium]|nr:hypothetical protein [Clostridiales bacterium]